MQGSVLGPFPEISHLISTMPMQGKCLHVTDKERGSERGSKLPDATQLKLMAELGLSLSLIPKPMSFPLYYLSHLKYVNYSDMIFKLLVF